MISTTYAQTMARYNKWQNWNIFSAADTLDDAARDHDRGAFFGSIRRTLNHLYWGDRLWMSRFVPTVSKPVNPGQASTDEFPDWPSLCGERVKLDDMIVEWSQSLDPASFEGDLNWYSGALDRTVTKPMDLCIVGFFNHQIHHRGQVHAMLTAAGARPDDTDLIVMPESV